MSRRLAVALPLTMLGFALLGADQAMKGWVQGHLEMYDSTPVAGLSFFHLTHVMNRGLWGQRFSALPLGEIEWWIRYLPSAFLGTMILTFLCLRARKALIMEWVGFTLFLSGGISNLADHWRSYFVADTMRLYLFSRSAQSFNLADTLILMGALTMALCLAREILHRGADSQGNERGEGVEAAD